MVSRAEVNLPLLCPSNVQLDGRCSLDRLYFLVKFSKLINFYDEDNHVRGSWYKLLLKDPVISSAYISKTPYAEAVKEYIDLSSKLDELINATHVQPSNLMEINSKVIHIYTKLFDLIECVFLEVFEWYEIINSQLKEYSFRIYFLGELGHYISRELKRFIQLYKSFCFSNEVDRSANLTKLEMIYGEWKEVTKQTVTSNANQEAVSNIWSVKEGRALLSDVHQNIFGFYLKVINSAKNSYNDLISNSSSYPDTALVIAFIKMLDGYKNQLNKNVEKHLDFYYKNILMQNNRDEVQDKAYISLEIEKSLSELIVPKNTKFNAGSYYNKKPIIFSNDIEYCINGAFVSEAVTVSYKRSQPHKRLLAKKNVSGDLLKPKDKGTHDPGIDMFGSNRDSKIENGFMLSSPLFLLGTGNRKIIIIFNIESIINPFIGSRVFLTESGGWFKPENITWSVDDKLPNRYSLTINLLSSDPSIELSKDLEIAGEFSWPLIKIFLNEVVDLKDLVIVKSINISVNVNNAIARYSNDYGIVKDNGISSPFGPAPKINSHFYVDLPELYLKPILSIGIVFSWNNVPESFGEYYETYNNYLAGSESAFSNNCFKVRPNVMLDGQWQGISSVANDESNSSQGSISLYQSEDGDPNLTNIRKTSVFSLYPSTNKPIVFQSNIDSCSDLLAFKSKPGLIKFTFDSPSMGFGHDIYSDVISSVTVNNANSFHKQEVNKGKASSENTVSTIEKLPNLPFTPMTNSISLNYSACCEIDFSGVNNEVNFQFYHCGVFSIYKVFDSIAAVKNINTRLLEKVEGIEGSNKDGVDLFPVIDFTGALFLNLENVEAPCSVSFLFEMSDWGGSSECDVASIYKFHYMTDDGWKSLKVLSDDTNNFSSSGIVVIYLPEDLVDKTDTISTKGYWIAISSYSENSSIGRLKSINTQAIQVNRVPPCHSLSDEVPRIKRKSISSSIVKIPGVKKIYQPFDSGGGKKKEDKDEFRKRVSRRLRTKDRAVTARDFELLSLEVSPELHFARCVKSESSTSDLNLVVVNSVNEGCKDDFVPSLVSSQKLVEIKKYLVARASPFIRVSVFNMRYQPVRVLAKILFVDNNGTLEQCNSISNHIKEFMSPWCSIYKNTMSITGGLKRADLLNLIISQPGVLEVTELMIKVGVGDTRNVTFMEDARHTLYPQDNETFFVSANDHQIVI